jgi:hypothetical protein
VTGAANKTVGVHRIELDEAGGHGRVDPEYTVTAQEVANLLGGAVALGAHEHIDGVAGPRDESASVESAAPVGQVGRRAHTEDANSVKGKAQRADGLCEGHHGGVIRPDAAVDQASAVERLAGEVCGRGSGGHGDIDRLLAPVPGQRCQMGRAK